jgi:small conductance mechanosensitive channel
MIFQNTNVPTKVVENASQVTNVAWQSINNIIISIVQQLPYILAGLLVLCIFLLVSRIVKAIFWSASGRTRLDYRLRVLFSRLVAIGFVILGIFTSLTVIVPSFKFGDLIAGLGFTSFVVGFATKDILNNFLSGILILWKQPFHIGDYLFVTKYEGKVEHIGVRATRLRTDDGEQILIPNGDMYSSALAIRGAGEKRRMSLKIALGYDTDIPAAKAAIVEALRTVKGVVCDPSPAAYVRDLTAEGVQIAVYIWIDTNEEKPTHVLDRTAETVKTALDRANIQIYPPGSLIVQRPRDASGEPFEAEAEM